MDIIGSILSLERAIPDSILGGVLSGEYSVHGGVIRNASGQIVRHLVPAATHALDPLGILGAGIPIYNTLQLTRLTALTEQILAISTATMVLGGLNVAISALGFAFMHKSHNALRAQLEANRQDTVWIRDFLETGRDSDLLTSIKTLASLPKKKGNPTNVLEAAQIALSKTSTHFLLQWDRSKHLLEKMTYQHLYCESFLAASRCAMELGEYPIALDDFQEGVSNWRSRTRDLAKEMLGEEPSRFLGDKYVSLVPAAKLCDWMDFAHAQAPGEDAEGHCSGWGWIDELRKGFSPSIIDRLPPIPLPERLRRKDPEDERIRYLDNIVARDRCIDGLFSQLQFLAEAECTPSTLDREIQALPLKDAAESDAGDKVFILAPMASAV